MSTDTDQCSCSDNYIQEHHCSLLADQPGNAYCFAIATGSSLLARLAVVQINSIAPLQPRNPAVQGPDTSQADPGLARAGGNT